MARTKEQNIISDEANDEPGQAALTDEQVDSMRQNIAASEPAEEPKTAWDVMQEYNQQNGYVDPFNAPAGVAGATFDLDEEIMIDTTGAATRGLPTGAYKGRCVGIRPGKPSGGGDPCYIWTFQVMEGPHAGETMDQYTYTGPKTLWKFAETKFALGFGDKDGISPRKIMNRACLFIVGESVYQGKTRVSLDTVNPPQDRAYGSVWEGDPETEEAIPF